MKAQLWSHYSSAQEPSMIPQWSPNSRQRSKPVTQSYPWSCPNLPFQTQPLVLPPFCAPCSSQTQHLKFDEDVPHLCLKAILCDELIFGTNSSICACWNPTILKGSMQMLSLPWSLPWFPKPDFPSFELCLHSDCASSESDNILPWTLLIYILVLSHL